jgi:cytoskeletal protein CcmA (bactofilin family)
MSLWKDSSAKDIPLIKREETEEVPPKEVAAKPQQTTEKVSADPQQTGELNPLSGGLMKHTTERSDSSRKESFIAADLTIEGKVIGDGSVRIAGRFEGDLQVRGDLVVEAGAQVTGEIHADTVCVEGTVEGNITASAHVELVESSQVIGDLKAKSLTVAAGARMRGKVEFGWDEAPITDSKTDASMTLRAGNGSAL